MVGLPTRLLIAQRLLDRLATEDPDEAARLQANRSWFMLGALGPALGDFVPNQPGAPGGSARSPHYTAWQKMLRISMGDPRPSSPLPSMAGVLAESRQALELISQKVRDHDLVGLLALYASGTFDKLAGLGGELAKVQANLSDPSTFQDLRQAIVDSRPRIDDPLSQDPPNRWTGRDYLHWKRSGEFATRLVADAEVSGDDRFLAYARGWQVAYATLACGSGFVASIARSVYRTHWWRTRWVGNFVDTWVWGFYNQDPGSFGVENYPAWPSLCAAGLQGWIEVGDGIDPRQTAAAVVAEQPLPSALPPEFAEYWVGAWTSTYAPGDPTARPGADPLFTPERLQAGYAMTWLVLWFQTSGEVIGCNNAPAAPPAACGTNPAPPAWIDPSRINPATGQPFVPSAPHPALDPDEDEILCGIITGLLGVALAALGFIAVGWALIGIGVANAASGAAQLNWDELECQLYWMGVYLFNALGSLHRMLVFGGFQHPYAPELAAVQAQTSFAGLPVSFPTAAQTNCRSRSLEGPRQPWNGALSNWVGPPIEPIENPVKMLWWGEWWPSAIVDDDAENPATASILDQPGSFDSGIDGNLGPAVQGALAVFANGAGPLPNWNLDNDRGHGWLTWELHAPYASPVQAFPEP